MVSKVLKILFITIIIEVILVLTFLFSNTPEANSNLMFVTDDFPFYQKNVISKDKSTECYSSEIAKIYWEFEQLKAENKNYIEEIQKKYDLSEFSIKIFDNNIITLDSDYKIRSFYEKVEGHKKVIVFFHGILMSIFRKSFLSNEPYSLRAYFKNDFDILIPELPGSSINTYQNDEKNFEKMVDVCAKWLRDHYQGKKIFIGGHSFGCWLALKLAEKLQDQDVVVMLNNVFFNNQTATVWTLSPVNEKLIKSVTTNVYDNNEILQRIKPLHKRIFLLAHPKDFVCPYEDAKKLKSQNPDVHLVNLFKDSRNLNYRYHTKINFEENFWIAQNAHKNSTFFTKGNYQQFKQKLLKK